MGIPAIGCPWLLCERSEPAPFVLAQTGIGRERTSSKARWGVMSVCIKDNIQNMTLVIGCTVGCDYCYARNNVKRWHTMVAYKSGS